VGPLRRRSKAGDGRRLLTAGETGEDRRWPTPARRPAPVDGGRVGPGGDCRRRGTGRRQATADAGPSAGASRRRQSGARGRPPPPRHRPKAGDGRRRPVGRRQSTAAEWGRPPPPRCRSKAGDGGRPTLVDGGRVVSTVGSPRPKVPPSAFGQRRSTEGEWGRPPPPVKGRRRPTPVCREGDCHRSVQKRQSSFLD